MEGRQERGQGGLLGLVQSEIKSTKRGILNREAGQRNVHFCI